MKTAIKILWAAVIAMIVFVIALLIWSYADFKMHPEKRGMESAPWYTTAMIWGMIVAVLVIACIIAIAVLRHKLNK